MGNGLESAGLLSAGLLPDVAVAGGVTVSGTLADVSLNGLAANINGTTDVTCTLAALSGIGLSATFAAGTITVTNLGIGKSKLGFQQDGSNLASIPIVLTYTGTPTSIEASFNGGSYVTIVASPAGGAASVSLANQAKGQGTLRVRFTNDVNVFSDVALVTIGDIFMAVGQSQHVGHATGYVAPSTANGTPLQYGLDGKWYALTETSGNPVSNRSNGVQYAGQNSTSLDGQGTYFGKLAESIMATGTPFMIVPNAVGSSSVAAWSPYTDHFNVNSIYGAALTRGVDLGSYKCWLWFQGEADASAARTQAQYTADLNSMIDTFWADSGKPVMVYEMNYAGGAQTTLANVNEIKRAQRDVMNSHPHAIPGPSTEGTWTGVVHYTTTSDVNALASKVFPVFQAQFYGGTVVSCSTNSMTQTGQIAAVNSIVVSSSAAISSLSGLYADITSPIQITSSLGMISSVGISASVVLGAVINSTSANFSMIGNDATISSDAIVLCSSGVSIFSGLFSSVALSGDYANAPTGSGYRRPFKNTYRPPQ